MSRLLFMSWQKKAGGYRLIIMRWTKSGSMEESLVLRVFLMKKWKGPSKFEYMKTVYL